MPESRLASPDAARTPGALDLNLRQRLFLRYFCYPPPGRPVDAESGPPGHADGDPLGVFIQTFGVGFLEFIRGRRVLDIGCGGGEQVLAMAERGAGLAIGAELRPLYKPTEEKAREKGLGDRVLFTEAPVRELGEEAVDVVISQNSFEHFSDPGAILADARFVLKRGGRFYITFAPPWLNPYGVHHFFMIRRPWAHFLFSERTILGVRRLYRNDGAERYEDIEGGLNRMTVHKFSRLVRESGFRLDQLKLVPIRHTPRVLSWIPGIQEFVISRVAAVLTK